VNGENTLQVNSDTLATNREGVFAGGDVVSGPTSVILAIAAGRKAAASIDKYLGGNGVINEDLAFWRIPASTTWEDSILNIPRTKMPLLDDKKRNSSFGEVELGFTKEMAMIEAKRCLKCGQRIQIRVNVDLCRNCSTCQMVCSLTYQGVFNPLDSKILIEPNKIEYKDSCRGGCSLCIDYCPYGALERLA
jgi:Pyruvate/2-oxoacid:ferredoxin oxidoreductase delta subunit